MIIWGSFLSGAYPVEDSWSRKWRAPESLQAGTMLMHLESKQKTKKIPRLKRNPIKEVWTMKSKSFSQFWDRPWSFVSMLRIRPFKDLKTNSNSHHSHSMLKHHRPVKTEAIRSMDALGNLAGAIRRILHPNKNHRGTPLRKSNGNCSVSCWVRLVLERRPSCDDISIAISKRVLVFLHWAPTFTLGASQFQWTLRRQQPTTSSKIVMMLNTTIPTKTNPSSKINPQILIWTIKVSPIIRMDLYNNTGRNLPPQPMTQTRLRSI